MNNQAKWMLSVIILVFLGCGYLGIRNRMHPQHQAKTEHVKKATKTVDNKEIAKKKQQQMTTPISYLKPSETMPYPNLKTLPDLSLHVHILKNRVYIYSKDKLVYTMYCSAGALKKKHGKEVSATPLGTFHIQNERGLTFFNPRFQDGANYYVSFKDHGVYLFHTVPIDKDGKYMPKEAKKLGKQPASEGCVRLSVPDAKWLYNELPVGTKVVVTMN